MLQQKRIRVGVIGMYQSGKTVLLTSLINHLRNHKPEHLSLGTGHAEIGFLGDDLGLNAGFTKFPYPNYRSRLGNQVWPTKTLACSQYRCRLALRQKGGRARQIDLTLTDMAGERLADLPMAGRDFAQWSDDTLELLDMEEYSRHAAEYQKLLEQPNVPVDQILTSYRRVLAELILHCLPVVSPSTFLIDQKGNYVEKQDVERRDADSLVAKRVSGLDAAHQFAPLPKSVRERTPELATEFTQRYIEYRRQIVLPLTHWFTVCDTLLVVVDLTMLLAGGAGMYNGQTHMLRHALEHLVPGRGRLNRLFDWAVRKSTLDGINANDVVGLATAKRLRLPGVRRLAFVATKADQVHQQDRDNLLELLKDLTRHLAVRGQYLGGVKTQHFACAAVKSTESLDCPYLKGRLKRPSQAGDNSPPPLPYKTSRVPEQWPEDWSVGEYHFPNFWPGMPANRDRPPQHIGLERVLDFVLDVG